jgi:hypothetical protein
MSIQIDKGTKSYSKAVLVSLLMFLPSSLAYAGEGHLDVGNPIGPGSTVQVYVHFPGVFPGLGADSNGNVLVTVTKIKANEGAETKAGQIAAAINLAFNTSVATVAATAGGGFQVNLSYNKNGTAIAGNAWIPAKGDKTGEGGALASLDFQPPDSQLTALMGFDTGLSGFATNGGMSTFTAEFGYAGLSDSVNIAFNQLSAPTLDALTSAMFTGLLQGLPSQLQPDLHLDLGNDEISFDLPSGQTGYFAGTLSTDSLVETSGGLATASPEPASLLLIGSGFVCIAGFLRKRSRKPFGPDRVLSPSPRRSC